jgi:hypothetical protein
MGCTAVRVKRRRIGVRAILLTTLVGAMLGLAAGCGAEPSSGADGRLAELRREQWHQRVCLDFWMLAVADPSGTQQPETSEYWYRLARVEKRIIDAGGDPTKLIESPMKQSDMPIRWQADCAQMRLRVKQQRSELERAELEVRSYGRVNVGGRPATEGIAHLREVLRELERFIPRCGCIPGDEDVGNVVRLRDLADEIDRENERNAMGDRGQLGLPERGAPPQGR